MNKHNLLYTLVAAALTKEGYLTVPTAKAPISQAVSQVSKHPLINPIAEAGKKLKKLAEDVRATDPHTGESKTLSEWAVHFADQIKRAAQKCRDAEKVALSDDRPLTTSKPHPDHYRPASEATVQEILRRIPEHKPEPWHQKALHAALPLAGIVALNAMQHGGAKGGLMETMKEAPGRVAKWMWEKRLLGS